MLSRTDFFVLIFFLQVVWGFIAKGNLFLVCNQKESRSTCHLLFLQTQAMEVHLVVGKDNTLINYTFLCQHLLQLNLM
ncbi:Hypothetical predicted protein [Olea europaea subsp. europaea]|uniref:Uncharacterized protein n=1 Tax=Olea europaea subsp. europaea TaxID=158383 RepID=A0A8S0SSG0_OLEEU|nr:Hypothetical predicted protein [Olea europaea subsp. europaea]